MTESLHAGLLGLLAGSALMVGALVGLFTPVTQRFISYLMAFGAGALISAVAFDLMDQAYRAGGFTQAALGLLAGACVFFAGDAVIVKMGGGKRKRASELKAASAGLALALGALLDGIPESVAIGASYTGSAVVGWAMVGAVFVSNVPESLASAASMKKSGFSAARTLRLWGLLTVMSAVCAFLGHALLAGVSGDVMAVTQAFGAGAILAMLASTMMPEAYEQGGPIVGLVTALGFLAAFVLDKW